MGDCVSGDRPLDHARCKHGIYDRFAFRHVKHCSRKAVTEGYCKQHHPDAVAARRKENQVRWNLQMRRRAFPSEKNKAIILAAEALLAQRDGCQSDDIIANIDPELRALRAALMMQFNPEQLEQTEL
jgi:hypothetical protein